MPEDIRIETLNDYQMGELKRLKDWLYWQRVKVRQERDRAGRRLAKEEADLRFLALALQLAYYRLAILLNVSHHLAGEKP